MKPIGLLLVLALLAAVLAALKSAEPELRRYMKIRDM
jgi:hypothetical protein